MAQPNPCRRNGAGQVTGVSSLRALFAVCSRAARFLAGDSLHICE